MGLVGERAYRGWGRGQRAPGKGEEAAPGVGGPAGPQAGGWLARPQAGRRAEAGSAWVPGPRAGQEPQGPGPP